MKQLPLEQPWPYPMAAFDLEIAKALPEDREAWASHRPYGISCAAIAVEDGPVDFDVEFFTDQAPDVATRLLTRLSELAATHTIVGFNSASFDWDVLAEESGQPEWCARLAMDHIDLIHIPLCHSGYKKSLDSCCAGTGVTGKAHAVTLNDGSVLESMGGGEAPRLWGAGEHDAVLAYLREDVRATLELARAARSAGRISWVAASGRPRSASFERLFTVREALGMRMPAQHFLTPPWPSPAADMAWAEGVNYGQE